MVKKVQSGLLRMEQTGHPLFPCWVSRSVQTSLLTRLGWKFRQQVCKAAFSLFLLLGSMRRSITSSITPFGACSWKPSIGGPFGGKDEHYNSIPKRNWTSYGEVGPRRELRLGQFYFIFILFIYILISKMIICSQFFTICDKTSTLRPSIQIRKGG